MAQLVIEGFRWQMIPLYVVAVGLGVGDLLSMERALPWWRRVSRPGPRSHRNRHDGAAADRPAGAGASRSRAAR